MNEFVNEGFEKAKRVNLEQKDTLKIPLQQKNSAPNDEIDCLTGKKTIYRATFSSLQVNSLNNEVIEECVEEEELISPLKQNKIPCLTDDSMSDTD